MLGLVEASLLDAPGISAAIEAAAAKGTAFAAQQPASASDADKLAAGQFFALSEMETTLGGRKASKQLSNCLPTPVHVKRTLSQYLQL